MDLNQLTTGDRVLGGSGIVFLLSMFLPWFGAAGGHFNGWHYFLFGVIPLLLVVAVVTVVCITRFSPDTNLPELPLPLSRILLIVSGIATALVLLKIVIGDSVGGGFVGSFDLSRKFGIFLAFLAAAGVTAGAFLKMQAGDDAPTSGGTTPPQPF